MWSDQGQSFAVDRRQVIDVIRDPRMSPVPNAPAWLRGVLNRSGRAVPVVDCGVFAGYWRVGAEVREAVVVSVEGGEMALALSEPGAERLLARGGDSERFFDRPPDAGGVRIIALERFTQAIFAATEP